jgi:predicted dinucleotide-binding enzyme
MKIEMTEDDLVVAANKIRKNIHRNMIKQIKSGRKAKDLVGKVQEYLEKSKLDSFLMLEETVLIMRAFCKKKNDLLIISDDEKTAEKIANDLFQRGVNNILNIMAKEDVLDCSFDNDTNDFYFNMKQ